MAGFSDVVGCGAVLEGVSAVKVFLLFTSSVLLLDLFLIPFDRGSQARPPDPSGLEMLCFFGSGLLPQMLRNLDFVPFVGRTRSGCVDTDGQGGKIQSWSYFQRAGAFLKQVHSYISFVQRSKRKAMP